MDRMTRGVCGPSPTGPELMMKPLITPEPTRRTPAPGWERFLMRSIHPTAGSQFTAVLGPPPGPAIYVRRRRHRDKPL